MNLNEYINVVHNGNQTWFLGVKNYGNQKRILDTIRIKKYLSVEHKLVIRLLRITMVNHMRKNYYFAIWKTNCKFRI